MIEIISLGLNNLTSLKSAVEEVHGREVRVISRAEESESPHLFILPGTGNFGAAAREMGNRGFADLLRRTTQESSSKIFGICLGLQLLFESSEESPGSDGLGLVSGSVRRLVSEKRCVDRVPRVGWAAIYGVSGDNVFGAQLESDVYFSHSYHATPEGLTTNVLVSPHCDGSIFVGFLDDVLGGFQFHPERSSRVGLELMSVVLKWARCED